MRHETKEEGVHLSLNRHRVDSFDWESWPCVAYVRTYVHYLQRHEASLQAKGGVWHVMSSHVTHPAQ